MSGTFGIASCVNIETTDYDQFHSGVQDVAAVKFQVNCQFENKCGAALVMYKPQLSYLPRDEQLPRLLKEFHSVLKGMCIVTEVISCPAYILVMSTQSESWVVGPRTLRWLIAGVEDKTFSASLDASAPVLSGIALGGAAKAGWTTSAVHGIYRSGHDASPIYCPLYKLKQPPPSFWEVISGRRDDSKPSNLIGK